MQWWIGLTMIGLGWAWLLVPFLFNLLTKEGIKVAGQESTMVFWLNTVVCVTAIAQGTILLVTANG